MLGAIKQTLDIACIPLYLFALASDSAVNLRGMIGDSMYVRGFSAGYKEGQKDGI